MYKYFGKVIYLIMSILNVPGKVDYAGRDGFVWWLGEVEKVDLGEHRCKVRVIGWYTGHQGVDPKDGTSGAKKEAGYLKDIPTDDLPWAYVMLPNDQEGIHNSGTRVQLQVGAMVIGFFADGEEAQIPIVLGNIKGYKTTPSTVVADPENKLNYPEATQMNSPGSTKNNDVGNPQTTPATANAPGGEKGPGAAQGTPSPLVVATPGNAHVSSAKPSGETFLSANGIMGPAGAGLEADLKRMLVNIGQAYSSVIQTESGEFVSLVTGKLVKLNHLIDNVRAFVSRAITGIMSWLKEIIAKIIQTIIDKIVSLISTFIPIGATVAILELIEFILSLFCNFEGAYIIGYIQGALGNLNGFISSVVNNTFNKVASPVFALAQKAEETVNKVIGQVQNGLNQAIQVGQTLVSVINTVKGAAKVGSSFKDIFRVDFTKLNWTSIVSIIKLLLGLLIKKDCGREARSSRPKSWLPLLGSTECDDFSDALKNDYKLPATKAQYTKSPGSVVSNYFDNYFVGMDPNLMNITSYLNGAYTLNDATPGKEKRVESGPGAVSIFEDTKGNIHTNVPNNKTIVVGKDYCENTKGHRMITIEGDLTLKVMGDFNLEVGGTVNKHISAGMDVARGDSKQPKLVSTEASDKNINQQGDITLQAPNIKLTAISTIGLKAATIKNEAVTINNSADGEILNECGCETTLVNSIQTTIIALFNPLAPVTGRLTYMQGADMTIVQEKLIGIPGVPPVKFDVTLGVKQPTGFIRLATGAVNASSIDLCQGATAAAGRFVQGGSGLICDANNSGGGASIYHNAIGIFAAGCLVGPAQFYGLPIFLN